MINEFRKDLEVIKTQKSTISARLQDFPPLPPPAAGPTLFANSIVYNHLNIQVLTKSSGQRYCLRFTHKMKTINQRSSNVVVSGLKPNDALADEVLFKELCYAHLDCDVEVIKASRLGKAQDGTRPILVTLASHADASKLLTMVKTLRSSSDPVVRRDVFLNKHLTAAESKAAYEARVARRSRQPQASTSSSGSLINPRGSIPFKPSDDGTDLRVSTDSIPASI